LQDACQQFHVQQYCFLGMMANVLDHDEFGLNQSKFINVIEINNLEHDVIAKVCQLWRIML